MLMIRLNLSHAPNSASHRGENDPYVEGYQARQALISRSANPYRGLDSRPLWDEGWLEAQADTRKPLTGKPLSAPPCPSPPK